MTLPALLNETWIPPLTNHLTNHLMNHLGQSTLVTAFAWLLALMLSKNPARTRYWVWMVASVKFLLPFSLLIAAGEWLRSLIAAPIVVNSALANVTEKIAQPFPQTQFFDATSSPNPALHFAWLPVALLTVWLCGALVVAVRFGRGWWMVWSAKRAARPLELAAGMRVLCSPALIEPGIFGIFRPVLLMPEGVLERLTPEQLRAIVVHEMCHVRRHDNLTFAIHMVVETLFWFYPPVWWIGARLIEERERACDEADLQAGSEAEVYAQGILNVCKLYVESPLACVSGVSGSDLKKRIVPIMARNVGLSMSLGRKLALAGAALLAVTVPVLFGLAQTTKAVPEWETAAGGKMEFEVASIHLAKPETHTPPSFALDPGDNPIPPGGQFKADFPLFAYITFAYKLWPTQEERDAITSQLPKWATTESFVIQAEAEGNPTKDQMRLMVQSLLASHFKLAVHFEGRQAPVFALLFARPGKLGPKIRPHAEGLPCDAPVPHLEPGVAQAPDVFPARCNAYAGWPLANGMNLIGARNTTLPLIAEFLANEGNLGRPIVDRTGLQGTFDFTLQYAEERDGPAPPEAVTAPDQQGPTLREAIADQLGMRLEPARAQVSTLVIDHIEQPSPN